MTLLLMIPRRMRNLRLKGNLRPGLLKPGTPGWKKYLPRDRKNKYAINS
jgi:hypothetical protein